MARPGRPPKPIEEHKRTGTYNATRHKRGALAIVEPVAKLPHEFSAREAFEQIMADGVHWLGRTDAAALCICRSMLEEREELHAAAIAGSTESRKMLRDLDKQLLSLMGQLGFDPASRSRLGLAEVKTKSVLEGLRDRQASR